MIEDIFATLAELGLVLYGVGLVAMCFAGVIVLWWGSDQTNFLYFSLSLFLIGLASLVTGLLGSVILDRIEKKRINN